MTEGYHEYYLCGDRSLESVVRDQVLSAKQFEVPTDYLRDRMLVLANTLKIDDPYNVSVITDMENNIFNYRVEMDRSFTKEQLFELEESEFTFESIGLRKETIVLWLK